MIRCILVRSFTGMFSIIPGLEEYSSSDSEDEVDDPGSPLSFSDQGASRTASNATVDTESAPPKGISSSIWEKFKKLQQRREEASNEKIPDYKRQRRKRHRKRKDHGETKTAEKDCHGSKRRKHSEDGDADTGDGDANMKTEHWKDLKQYMGQFDRFKGTDQGHLAPKSGLEKKIDEAIAEGEFETAETLTEQLAQRELGEKIAEAADARDFAARKKEEEDIKAKKKKKKPTWTFEAKQRWEMKAAM
ncbi:protein FAM204A-like [Ptychodera flava]|uniref:protein FAM204A-like n=1 Tax=Ptychodera flava TaxID=63121 RepID=UPI00396A7804